MIMWNADGFRAPVVRSYGGDGTVADAAHRLSPDGTRVAAIGSGRTARVWTLDGVS
jgi:hypothetical protein